MADLLYNVLYYSSAIVAGGLTGFGIYKLSWGH
jgi:hypothetical protein